ncbi:conserved hypothetical protein [Candidatus Terasakiella magnetica]|nr:conserved hypothetical protein [Candidatus Terasakiella magnetica]
MSDQVLVHEEIAKAASLVDTARRLLATGTMVDLSALEGKIRFICAAVAELGLEDGRGFRSGMEALIADLDTLAVAIRERYDPPAAKPVDETPEG